MDGLNVLAVIVAAAAAFFLGSIWYSSKVFGGIWSRASGNTHKKEKKHSPRVFIAAAIFYLLSAFMFAILVGPQPELYYALKCGAEIGVFFVAASFGINYIFAGRSYKLLLIDGSYHTLQFILYGLVLGLWK